MDTPVERRKSTRLRQSVNYAESPQNVKDSPAVKSAKKIYPTVTQKTPKSNEESKTPKGRPRKARSESPENFSPKKLRNNRTPSSKALESIVLESSPTVTGLDVASRRSTRIRTPNKRFEDIDTLLNKSFREKRKSLNSKTSKRY